METANAIQTALVLPRQQIQALTQELATQKQLLAAEKQLNSAQEQQIADLDVAILTDDLPIEVFVD